MAAFTNDIYNQNQFPAWLCLRTDRESELSKTFHGYTEEASWFGEGSKQALHLQRAKAIQSGLLLKCFLLEIKWTQGGP